MKKAKASSVIAHLVLFLFCLFCIFPVLLLVIASFTDNDSIFHTGYTYFPEKWSLGAYQYLMTQQETILGTYRISLIVTAVGTLLGLTFTTMLGYAISRKELLGRRAITFFVFFTLLFNGGLVPTYLMYINTFHVKNTLWALLLPGNIMVNGFNVMLIRTYFEGNVPFELIESGKLDGAGEFRIFVSIITPVATPIIATVAMLIGVGYWNDWYNGLLYITDTKLFSLQNYLNRILLDIQFMTQTMSGNVNAASALAKMPTVTVRMAIAVIGMIPLMVIFPSFQKYFSKGITVGSVKG